MGEKPMVVCNFPFRHKKVSKPESWYNPQSESWYKPLTKISPAVVTTNLTDVLPIKKYH